MLSHSQSDSLQKKMKRANWNEPLVLQLSMKSETSQDKQKAKRKKKKITCTKLCISAAIDFNVTCLCVDSSDSNLFSDVKGSQLDAFSP